MSATTTVVVPSFAKINLDLRILHKRPDGFHELRTVFQTISLADSIQIDYEPSSEVDIDIESNIDIEDNIVLRAARSFLEYLDRGARLRFQVDKKIPLGAGLGGGSSNAAAVLLALPKLLGVEISRAELQRLASWLGSDVPVFLYGGTLLGLGRGIELYPLPDLPALHGVSVAPGIHVSTAEAYAGLGRTLLDSAEGETVESLTSPDGSPILGEFQSLVWSFARKSLAEAGLKNDFESVIFERHPELAAAKAQLESLGARPALMTGSGSSLFGIFPGAAEAAAAANAIPGAVPFQFLTRQDYEKRWAEALQKMRIGKAV